MSGLKNMVLIAHLHQSPSLTHALDPPNLLEWDIKTVLALQLMFCLTCCKEEGFCSLPEPDRKKSESECRALSELIHPCNTFLPSLEG